MPICFWNTTVWRFWRDEGINEKVALGPIDVAVRLVDDVDHDEDAGVEVDLDDDVVCRGCSIHL